ncbi:YIPF2 isoform 11, partial [Pongo abelii]
GNLTLVLAQRRDPSIHYSPQFHKASTATRGWCPWPCGASCGGARVSRSAWGPTPSWRLCASTATPSLSSSPWWSCGSSLCLGCSGSLGCWPWACQPPGWYSPSGPWSVRTPGWWPWRCCPWLCCSTPSWPWAVSCTSSSRCLRRTWFLHPKSHLCPQTSHCPLPCRSPRPPPRKARVPQATPKWTNPSACPAPQTMTEGSFDTLR